MGPATKPFKLIVSPVSIRTVDGLYFVPFEVTQRLIRGNSVVRALYQACAQRPKPGSTVSLSMDLFKNNAPQKTIPATSLTTADTLATSTSATRTSANSIAAPVASAVSKDDSGKSSHLAPGAKAGIGIGVSLVALGVLAAALTMYIRKRRRRAHLHEELVSASISYENSADAAHSLVNEMPDQPIEPFDNAEPFDTTEPVDTTTSTLGQQKTPEPLPISELPAAAGATPLDCIGTRPPC